MIGPEATLKTVIACSYIHVLDHDFYDMYNPQYVYIYRYIYIFGFNEIVLSYTDTTNSFNNLHRIE